ncbi:hypothetical protein MF672_013955 [Actinomadura sp. ATCC 31491]|uniref:PqqD family peptide modification chaperone n=1 Tax=Actinomadura luzonensis TaxID=2805427 RepID=A0ABT0FRC6_9ACTN|nr:hypothetical protein [Actinomadura luzonensis]MCK2214886.1 hypothetical protein [Actinomadura luzonensis]
MTAARTEDPGSATVRLKPLSVVPEGEDEVLVGDAATGAFVTIPAVGGVVIEALRRGATVAEAAAEAEEFAGQPVNVPSFVATLGELGFLADDDEAQEPVRTAPIQARRWMTAVRPEAVRPFFGPVAWACYAACLLYAVAVFVLRPGLLPDPAADAFAFGDTGLSALAWLPFVWFAAAGHECGHWLGARAAGIQTRFGVDRRLWMLVFETDLTQLWTLPRGKRYGPLLAGLAVDSVLLAVLLTGRLLIDTGLWAAPGLVASLLAAWVFIKVMQMLWQCLVFLRTDLYAVLVNALGCRNLWRVKSLMLRRAFGRLTAEQAAELAEATETDLRVGRWFRWVWLAGFAGVVAWFCVLLLPVFAEVLRWTAEGLAEGPLTAAFWYRLLCAGLLLGPETMALALTVKEYAARLAARR